MTRPHSLPLSSCCDVTLVGGKAVGLARLIAAGFPVPPGCCITTATYAACLDRIGLSYRDEWRRIVLLTEPERAQALAACRAKIRQADLSAHTERWEHLLLTIGEPDMSWAVRSSATNEDAGAASFAGLYRTRLGVPWSDLDASVKDLWASLWEERVVRYILHRNHATEPPAMAVVIQPMLDAVASGVVYSIHPVTGSNHVVVNAVLGLAAPLVDGRAMPDQFIIGIADDGHPSDVQERLVADKPERLAIGEDGLRTIPVTGFDRATPSLDDAQLMALARMTKQIERAFGYPVDLEWAWDAKRLWILQVRPITAARPLADVTRDACEWSRTNFKETMPEVPSPLGLSFLEYFMDRYILAHYRRLGCHVPEGWRPVRIVAGRPYLNVTLFYSLVGQVGGDPSLNLEHMGGAPLRVTPPIPRLGWWALGRAGWLMWKEMRRCTKNGPRWFAEMKRQAQLYRPDRIRSLPVDKLAKQVEELGRWLDDHEVTFGIAAGVGQCLQTFSLLLPGWLGPEWRRLLNGALQGQGTVVSAQQIIRLAELADVARREPATARWFLADSWEPDAFREALAGTSFLRAFDDYLAAYGHRAVGESDIASPRMTERPVSILQVLRTQLRAPAAASPADILGKQARQRREALAEIKRRLGWRIDRWLIFLWWYRRLCRFFALREANRHHLMYYSTAARTLLLRLGELLTADGLLNEAEDILFVTLEERTHLFGREPRDWKAVVRGRRAAQSRDAALQVPDTIGPASDRQTNRMEPALSTGGTHLRGLPISVGRVTGLVRRVLSPADWGRVQPGDIIVTPVIDPGLAPLFGIAGGVIAVMGGTLSHGAIIAREYGLPAVANVGDALARLYEGQRVTLDAGEGLVSWDAPSDSSTLGFASRAD